MRRDDDIFADALDLPVAERAAFLDRTCADPAQRTRIEALLAGEAAAARFMEAPAVPRPELPAEEMAGETIGRYLLRRHLGEGGCGTVWLAEQTEPVRRQVALKIIKLGMDTREVIRRFEAERQALALMDHPGIARVFDAGATDTGRPYFVMEFVDGLPITRFCDEHRLPTDARLELFAQVCVAIQHAHQKGIIHRDVKPSNVLVTMVDGAPAPKIIDFGIAKATQGRLAEQTLLTQRDQLIGTPAYMSPEQVEARELDIDTRSDVYALGVLLYELLTGLPPYDPHSLIQAGLAEIRRIIREVDPPRPSTRLSTLTAADRATVAGLRGAAPVQLTSVLRGELDWIVMRCLEKDRGRRYGTAHELADDVRRHLRHEVVAARPPDALYLTRKFVSRHRLVCASAAAIALTLVGGATVSLIQANRARRAETAAVRERDTARAAQQAEATARADAQRRQEQAESLLTFMLGDFRTELKKIGRLNLLDAVGEKALAHFSALNPADLTDTVLTSQAKALTQIGETRLDQARFAEATQAFTAAYDRSAALFARHPGNADMLFERAQAEFWLGFTARRSGDQAAALTWLTRYRDSAVSLHAIEPTSERAARELSSGRFNLAVLLFDAGDVTHARNEFRDLHRHRLALVKTNPENIEFLGQVAETLSWLARTAEVDGEYPEAITRHQEFIALMDVIIARAPDVVRWQYRRADAGGLLATVQGISGDRELALKGWRELVISLEHLTQRDPANQQWLVGLLNARLQVVRLRLAISQEAVDNAEVATLITHLEQLAAKEPASRIFRARLVTAWAIEAQRRLATKQSSVEEAATRAISLGDDLVAAGKADAWVRFDIAQAHLVAGRAAARHERPSIAMAHWKAVIALLDKPAANSRDWRLLDPLAQALHLSGRSAGDALQRLRAMRYRAIDPLAATTLEAAQ